MCGGEYETAWSDSEAVEELEQQFPGVSKEQCEIVCDDCAKKIGLANG
jgi:hypothetical protein